MTGFLLGNVIKFGVQTQPAVLADATT
jgi:hypothetical protein